MKIMGISDPPAAAPARAGARFGSELRSICVSEADTWTHIRAASPLHISLALSAPQRDYEWSREKAVPSHTVMVVSDAWPVLLHSGDNPAPRK